MLLDHESVAQDDGAICHRTESVAAKPGNTTRVNQANGRGSVTVTSPEYEPFPVRVLPPLLADFVAASSAALGCDPAFVAVPLLSVLAAIVGTTRGIRLKKDWTEPCIIWSVILGTSGSGKSPAFAWAVRLIERLQARDHAAYQAAVREANRQAVAPVEDGSDSPEACDESSEPEPVERRWLTTDATIEALGPLLAQNPRGVLVAVDELAGWIASFDAYKQTKGGDAPRWLSLHRAGLLLTDRKTGQRVIHVPRAAISLTGTCQPETFGTALSGGRSSGPAKQAHIENGVLARLLCVMPPLRPKQWSDAEVDAELLRAIEQMCDTLSKLEHAEDDSGQPCPVELPLTAEAKERWIQFFDEHAIETVSSPPPVSYCWSKLEAYAGRFSLLFHVVRHITGQTTVFAVEACDVASGIELARWFGQEARRVYRLLGIETATPKEVERLEAQGLVAIAERRGGELTVRDLQHASRRHRPSAEVAEAALKRAERLGFFVSSVDTETGGRPVVRWRLKHAGNGNGSLESDG